MGLSPFGRSSPPPRNVLVVDRQVRRVGLRRRRAPRHRDRGSGSPVRSCAWARRCAIARRQAASKREPLSYFFALRISAMPRAVRALRLAASEEDLLDERRGGRPDRRRPAGTMRDGGHAPYSRCRKRGRCLGDGAGRALWAPPGAAWLDDDAGCDGRPRRRQLVTRQLDVCAQRRGRAARCTAGRRARDVVVDVHLRLLPARQLPS